MEARKIIIPPTSKLKGCAHTNEDEEDPNGQSTYTTKKRRLVGGS
jgi:hypothetical protein